MVNDQADILAIVLVVHAQGRVVDIAPIDQRSILFNYFFFFFRKIIGIVYVLQQVDVIL